MKLKQIVVYPGQKVIAADGKVHTIWAILSDGAIIDECGQMIAVLCDAWGGENDQEIGLAA